MAHYRIYTGPTIVKQTADKLRAAGIKVSVEGTEGVNFETPIQSEQLVEQELRKILGPQWGVKGIMRLAAKEKTYLNTLDQLLNHGVEEADMSDSRSRGDELSELTQALAEDGEFTKHIHASTESARTHIAKKLSDDNILNDVTVTEREAKSNKDGLASAANEKAVMSAIDTLLHQGVEPHRIMAALAKCAELNLYNKQFATDHLNRRIGELGMNYLQPNTFMPKEPDTYGRKKVMASVHVSVEGEDVLGLGESKFGGRASVQRPAVEVKVAERQEPKNNAPTVGRVPNPVEIRGAAAGTKTAAVHHRGSDIDSGFVAEQHTAGKSFEQIWLEACQHAGLHLASKAFNEFVSRARRDGAKFAAADVAFLREKLGHKGIEVAAEQPRPLPRVAYDSGKQGGKAQDGHELLKEFDLHATEPGEIEYTLPGLDVEAGKPEVNL